ncbi:MAG: PAS domain S-box protein, partial [Nitrospirae bacterium]
MSWRTRPGSWACTNFSARGCRWPSWSGPSGRPCSPPARRNIDESAMKLPHNKAGVVWGLIVLLGSAVFAWDIMTPLGQVPWLLYVPILLLTWWIPHRKAAFMAAGVFSLLIVLDHFLSPQGVGPRISIFNRSLGISTIWIVAALVEVWKRTDESLRQSETILRSFYNSASMMMGIAEIEGDDIRPISVNAATARFLGTTLEAMRDRRASELGAPRETILEWIRRYRECVQTGSPVRFEYLRATHAGPRQLAATVCHVGGAGPSAARFAYIVEDVTESRRAEGALRRSEARLHAILENSPTMIFLKDTEGRYLLSNREFEKITHRPGKDIIGKTDIDLFLWAQATVFRANDRRVLEAQTPMTFEEVALHDDGPHTGIVSKFPLFDGNGKVYAIGGIVTDIT